VTDRKRDINASPEQLKQLRTDCYTRRNNILKSMGFASYQEYLRSNLWAKIRAKVLYRQPRCYGCNEKATQVHHNSYERKDLDGTRTRHLRPVCDICHTVAEFRSDGEKVTVLGAKRALKTIHRSYDPSTVQYVSNGICKRCMANIRWFRTPAGKFIPFDSKYHRKHWGNECRRNRRALIASDREP
jgi:hypothetical protein